MASRSILRRLVGGCAFIAVVVGSTSHAAVGTISGNFAVTPAGAATYSIPITVPPGTAGMKPNLRLRYSSHGGNGVLGVGWTLSGISRITRCPATYAQDNFIDAMDFDDNDRLCLDGERLIAVAGEYGESGTEYRTEIESFVRVQQNGGDLNSGSAWFKVNTKDGLVKKYGHNNNSSFIVPGKPYTYIWSIDSIEDTIGNYIEFLYTFETDSNEYYIDRIEYTGNTSTGLTPYNSVQFEYENRQDVGTRYMTGGSDLISNSKRLAKIRTSTQSEWVREYRLSYASSPSSGRSLLTTVQECARVDSGSDCLSPLDLSWTTTTLGYTEHVDLSPPTDSYQCARVIDINGDGLSDIVQGCSGNIKTWINTHSDNSQSWEQSSSYKLPKGLFTSDGDQRATLKDINGDGLPDLVEAHSSSEQDTYLNTGSGWEIDQRYKLPKRLYDAGGRPEGVIKDINGDGIKDLIISIGEYQKVGEYEWEIVPDVNKVWIGSDASCSGSACAWGRSPSYDVPSLAIYVPAAAGELQRLATLQDINGDGLPDYILSYSRVFTSGFWLSQEFTSETYVNTGSGWVRHTPYDLDVPLTLKTSNTDETDQISELVDVNGDGLLDIVCATNVPAPYTILKYCGENSLKTQSETGEGQFNRATYINTGNGFEQEPSFNAPTELFTVVVGDPRRGFLEDLNGDSRPEFILSHADYGRKTYRNNYQADCSSDASRWVLEESMNLPFDFFGFVLTLPRAVNRRSAVRHFDLDGRPDFIALGDETSNSATYVSHGSTINGDAPDLLRNIDGGQHSHDIVVNYTTLLDRSSYSETIPTYPKQGVRGGYPIVEESTRGGSNVTAYSYKQLRSHTLGRGMLGFRQVKIVNLDTGISETTEYSQAFPHIGMVLNSTVTATEYYEVPGYPDIPIGESILSKNVNTLEVNELGSGSSVRHFPYVAVSDEEFFDLQDDAVPLTTTRTEFVYDNFGNATEVVQSKFQGSSPGSGVHVSVTTNQFNNDTNQWLLGRLSHTAVTKTNPNGDSITRETAYEYNAVTGLLTAEIVEPNDADLWQRTDYSYDSFGNQTEVTVSGADIDPRTTTTTWDSRGQFKETVTNALGHAEIHDYSAAHGGQVSLTGPNNLTTTWAYDAFGRETQQTAPDGTTVTTSYEGCSTSCPVSEGAFAIRTIGSDGSESLEVFDRLERKVLDATRGYDGNWIDVVTQYDSRDRKIAQTAPHYRNGEQHWTTYEYDDHDRLIRTESPTNEASDGGVITEIEYDGLIVRQTDPNGKVSEKHENAAGRTVKVVDALSGTTEFEYGPYGNKMRVIDAAGNITTMTYDKLGRKLTMSDPDMGDWTYAYDVLGNLISQTDAKGQTVAFQYDKLDRKVQRSEPEGVTTWTYDTEWIGKPSEEIAPGGFQRSYAYDSLGRVADVATIIDSQTYTVSRTYDDESRLNKLTYPSGFAIRHTYTASGYLDTIVDDDTGDAYWQLDHRDAFGNIEMATYGNGHSTVRNHDNARGHIDAVLTGTNPGSEVQSQNYEWDKVGNLLVRVDQNQNGLTEEFEYDDLYRLTGSTLNDATNLNVAYDAIGNITSKSGVGSYTYGANDAGPHAVTQITGPRAAAYSYDANGNMTQGAGRTLTWTSFNKPATVTKGQAYSEFHYGPDRARYKHIREREENGQLVSTTIHYVGNLYERHYEGTGFEDKHYLQVDGEAVAIEVTRSNGTEDTQYLHKDHLGSITAITNDGGAIVEEYAYDAFGKRRGLAWDPDSNDSLLYLTIQVLDRGYTGHEHLDHVGLIHMNGRVYDPVIGRFASADSFVQMPESTQGLNRYTYVQNNPLSYVDPSGHFFSAIVGAIAAAITATATAIAAAAAAIANFVAPFALELGIIGVGIATDNPTLTSIGFALMPGGDFLQSAILGFGAGYAATGDFETAAISGLTAGLLSQIGTAESFYSKDNIGKALKRGMVGGVSTEAQGGKFDDGFLSVGAGSILSPGIDKFDTVPGRIAAASTIGGTVSELGGGKFANGAATAAYLQTAVELPRIYKDTVGYKLDIRSGGKAVEKDILDPPIKGANNIGEQGGRINAHGRPVNCAALCLREGGGLSRVLNRVPGVNAVAGLHDVMQINLGDGLAREILNFPGMVPAAGVTYSAFVGQALQPLSSQQVIHLSVSNSFDRNDDRRNVYGAAAIGAR